MWTFFRKVKNIGKIQKSSQIWKVFANLKDVRGFEQKIMGVPFPHDFKKQIMLFKTNEN